MNWLLNLFKDVSLLEVRTEPFYFLKKVPLFPAKLNLFKKVPFKFEVRTEPFYFFKKVPLFPAKLNLFKKVPFKFEVRTEPF